MHIPLTYAPVVRCSFAPDARTFVVSALLLISLLLVSACDNGDLLPVEKSTLFDLRNDSTGNVKLEIQELGRTEDGVDTEMVLVYTLSGLDPSSLPSGTALKIRLVDDNGITILVTDAIPLDPDSDTGEIALVAPGNAGEVAAVATLEIDNEETGEPVESQADVVTAGILAIDLSNRVKPTDLSAVDDFSLELVDNSYESALEGQRRVHRFTVRAYDQNCVSIRGLNEDVGEYFTLYENSFVDVESPVVYDSRNSFVNVYFVLDASSSVTDGDRQQIMNAARYASDRMRDDYVMDFRQFSGDILKLDDYRDYQPDDGESATAFYYAIDTVLEEIEARGRTDDYNVIIGFTDGIDLASRNHYGDALSNQAIQEMIRDKVSQFRNAPGFDYGSGLELHLLSVGNVTAQKPALDSLANSGGGQHLFASDKSALEPMLEALVDRILATYHLQYSSQQQADDSGLLLEVTINDVLKPLQIRHAGGFNPVDTPHFCEPR